MKIHTTNYNNAFIAVAEDCPTNVGEVPPLRGDKKSIANWQYDLISENPYQFTSDDVIFQVFAIRNDLAEAELEDARKQFFSKGQACLRSSPLTKRYGWGVHSDEEGRVAIYGMETEAYEEYVNAAGLEVVKAMRSKRKK